MPCPRCSGLVINDYGDVRCVNCGWRSAQLDEPSICKASKKSGRCTKKAMKKSEYCAECDRIVWEQRRGKGERYEFQEAEVPRRIIREGTTGAIGAAIGSHDQGQEAIQAARDLQDHGQAVEVEPRCLCGKTCAYYGEVGGYSVACVECNEKKNVRQQKWRALRKALRA